MADNQPMDSQDSQDDYIGSIPYLAGRFLASPEEGEEIVISGIAGQYPDSHNVYHFRDNLLTKTDMVSCDSRRWRPTHPEIPQRTGKLHHVDHFDPGHFGIHHRQAEAMDPCARLLLERAAEAALDAGLPPSALAGTRTGVFVGACFSESEKTWFFDSQRPQQFAVTGNERSMIANRVSYALRLTGPSFVTDTACSSSLYALDQAYKALRHGTCDYAIVGGTNVCLHPFVSLQFARLGVLSPDGTCKVFDQAADGYARSEAIVAIFLQRASTARRAYAQLVHAKTNCDGFKPQSITYPSGEVQKRLLQEFYAECQVDPCSLSFLEAHGTGTKVGDPEELQAIDEIFCQKRGTPLLIGSVKSNIGHSEPSSGLCSITKAVIGMETGLIPPNLHFSKVREGIDALEKGRMKVVTQPTPFEDDRGLVGVNSFGFGGGNAHVLLRWNRKVKQPSGDALPRLVTFSGRVAESLTSFQDDLAARSLDPEFVGLLHGIFHRNIDTHLYRGYSIVAPGGEVARSGQFYGQDQQPLHLVLTDFGAGWARIAENLSVIPAFQSAIEHARTVLALRESEVSDAVGALVVHAGLLAVLDLLQVKTARQRGYGASAPLAEHLAGALTLDEAILRGCALASEKPAPEPAAISFKGAVIHLGLAEIKGQTHHFGPTPTLVSFLQLLGQLYEIGHDLPLELIYPKVDYPVSRGTPMISPLIKWDHRRPWYVTYYDDQTILKCGERSVNISGKDDDWAYIGGHLIDGRNLFPATGYLMLAWEALSKVTGVITTDMKVCFENVKFLRATTMPKESKVELTVMVQRGTGNFEVIEGGVAIVTGRIGQFARAQDEQVQLPVPLGLPADEWLPMKEKDIYKELRLRGYNYKGDFRRMEECDNGANVAQIRWDLNWVAFMDNMLQLKILQIDTRHLYVPTAIRRLTIDAREHLSYTQKFGEKPLLPVYIHKDCDVIRCGGIEIRGLMANSIARRKQRGDPVLEKFIFAPNIAEFELNDSIRVNVQLALENLPAIKVKVVELIDEATGEELEPMATTILEVLGDLPLLQPTAIVLTSKELEIKNVTVEDRKLITETDSTFVVGSKLLQRVMILNQAFGALKEGGFVISREPIDFTPKDANLAGIDLLTVHTIAATSEKLYLIRKQLDPQPLTAIDVTPADFSWLAPLQKAIKSDPGVLLLALNHPESGILGLANCLRREPASLHVRALFAPRAAPPFDLHAPFYAAHLAKGLAVNVLQDGEWGTYRHLLLPPKTPIACDHVFVNSLQRGDLSSLKWIEGPLRLDATGTEKELVHVYYSALNFRDVMTASGRISADVITRARTEQEFITGFEYAGRTLDGRRVMGISSGALSNLLLADRYMTWPVPELWSMEEAATIPAVYSTILYAFFIEIRIRRGQSILIHAGTGGIGQSAIALCLHHGLTVFTTCGTPEKRAFLLERFPRLAGVGSSRDTTFEQLVRARTAGRGVDVVLNSLAEEKLIASVRCLAPGGHFLEIGKFDLASNNPLRLALLERDATFHGIMVDSVFRMDPKAKLEISRLINAGMASGAIQPLVRTVFGKDEVEQAFRHMAAGKHIGKVLIRLREEEPERGCAPVAVRQLGLPRFACQPDKVQVIVGGLGGFGLELVDWLILRGARHVVLTSRRGVTNGYQAYRIRTWRAYNATVHVSTVSVASEGGCEELVREAQQFGEIESIFNLAVVLKDQLLENQTAEDFATSLTPKAYATKFLDAVTRRLCPTLAHFVVFSSVSCGRGNAGQSNYGMANSVMERICERRHAAGLPALAIQWGAVGDVGLVAEMQEENNELEIGGTLQQRIFSCMAALDALLRQPAPVVSSMVVAEKRAGHGGADNIVDAVAAILGLGDLKTVSLHASLSELGMDSMTAVEIKQTLEREYEVFLTPQDIRTLTFARLQELQEEREGQDENAKRDRPLGGFEMIVRLMNDEQTSRVEAVRLASRGEAGFALLFPGIEGVAKVLEPLAQNLRARVECLQYLYEGEVDTIAGMAERLMPAVEARLDRAEPFRIVAYSFGVVVAFEVVARLEKKGYSGTMVAIDGSAESLGSLLRNSLDINSEAIFQTGFLVQLMSLHTPIESILKNREKLLMCSSFEERLNVGESIMPQDTPYSNHYLRTFSTAIYKRLKALGAYASDFGKVRSVVKLYKPHSVSIAGVADDYKFGELVEGEVEVRVFKGNHVTILDNLEMAEAINEVVEGGVMFAKEQILDGDAIKNAEIAEIKQI